MEGYYFNLMTMHSCLKCPSKLFDICSHEKVIMLTDNFDALSTFSYFSSLQLLCSLLDLINLSCCVICNLADLKSGQNSFEGFFI